MKYFTSLIIFFLIGNIVTAQKNNTRETDQKGNQKDATTENSINNKNNETFITPGASGVKRSIGYRFSTQREENDPGNGVFRYNSDTISKVTWMYVDNIDLSGEDQTKWYSTWEKTTGASSRGSVSIVELEGKNVVDFDFTGVFSDGSGYWKFPVKYITGTYPADGTTCYFVFNRIDHKKELSEKENQGNKPVQEAQPVAAAQPLEIAQPVPSVQPVEVAQPVAAAPPVEVAPPVAAAPPVEVAQPVAAALSVEVAQPVAAAPPIEVAQPVAAAPPVEVAQPVPSAPPIEVAQPVAAAPPVEVAQPVAAAPPVEVAQPVAAAPPVEVAQPVAAVPPDEVAQPVPSAPPIEVAQPVAAAPPVEVAQPVTAAPLVEVAQPVSAAPPVEVAQPVDATRPDEGTRVVQKQQPLNEAGPARRNQPTMPDKKIIEEQTAQQPQSTQPKRPFQTAQSTQPVQPKQTNQPAQPVSSTQTTQSVQTAQAGQVRTPATTARTSQTSQQAPNVQTAQADQAKTSATTARSSQTSQAVPNIQTAPVTRTEQGNQAVTTERPGAEARSNQFPVVENIFTSQGQGSARGGWYRGIIEIGYAFGLGDYGINNFRFNFINGIHLGKFSSIGLGIGYRYYFTGNNIPPFLVSGKSQIPVFLDLRTNFSTRKVTPYLAFGIGTSAAYGSSDAKQEGLLINPSGGIWFNLSSRFAVFAGIDYELQKLEFSDTDPFTNNYKKNASSLGINIGISF